MISVIVPVYNTEQYLRQCINSILDSVYQDFELILINDGSEDRSLEICQEYSEKDHRIQWINQEHAGVSAARNQGLEQCHGDWVVFVDSDDSVSNDFLGSIVQEEHQDSDLLIFDFLRQKRKRNNGTGHKNGCGKVFQYASEDRQYFIESFLTGTELEKNGNMSLLSLWAKAYKKSVLEQYAIRFQTGIVLGEDRLFNLEYLLHMQSCIYIQKEVYFAGLRPDSAMHGFYSYFLRNDVRYQKQLKDILEKQGLLSNIEESYCSSVLSCMADVLIRGIFHPCSTRNRNENYRLCKKMHQYGIYRQALRYNGKTGVIPRRILLFFFRKQCYGIVMLISRICYKILDMAEEL